MCLCLLFMMFSHQMVILTWNSEYFLRKSVVKFLWKIFKFKMKMIQWGGKILYFNVYTILSIKGLQWTFHQWHDEGCCISPAPACNKWFSVSKVYKSSSEFSKNHTVVSVSYYICKPHKQNCSPASPVSGIH